MTRLKDNELAARMVKGAHAAGLLNITTNVERTEHAYSSVFHISAYHVKGERIRFGMELTDLERVRNGGKMAQHAEREAHRVAIAAIQRFDAEA